MVSCFFVPVVTTLGVPVALDVCVDAVVGKVVVLFVGFPLSTATQHTV